MSKDFRNKKIKVQDILRKLGPCSKPQRKVQGQWEAHSCTGHQMSSEMDWGKYHGLSHFIITWQWKGLTGWSHQVLSRQLPTIAPREGLGRVSSGNKGRSVSRLCISTWTQPSNSRHVWELLGQLRTVAFLQSLVRWASHQPCSHLPKLPRLLW